MQKCTDLNQLLDFSCASWHDRLSFMFCPGRMKKRSALIYLPACRPVGRLQLLSNTSTRSISYHLAVSRMTRRQSWMTISLECWRLQGASLQAWDGIALVLVHRTASLVASCSWPQEQPQYPQPVPSSAKDLLPSRPRNMFTTTISTTTLSPRQKSR